MKLNKFWIIILLFVFLTSFNILFKNNLWFDSAYTLEYVNQNTISSMLFNPVDVHPPLYYIVLKGWFLFGESIIWARLLSVLFGVIFLYLVYLITDKLFNDEYTSLFVTTIVAVSSTYLNIFTEIRMYSFALMLISISFYFLLKSKEATIKDNNFFMYFLTVFLAIWTHYYVCFYILVSFIYIYFFKKNQLKNVFKTFISYGAIFYIPLMIYFLTQLSKIEGMWFKGVTFMSFFSSLNYAFFHSNTDLMSNIGNWIGYFFVIAIFFLNVYYIKKEENIELKRIAMFLIIAGTVPQLIGLIINNFYSVYHHRFFIFTLWFYVIVSIRSFVYFMNKYKIICLYILFVLFISFNLVEYYDNSMTELVTIGEFVNEHYCYDDILVLHESPFTSVTSQYYLRIGNCFSQPLLFSALTDKQFGSAGGAIIYKDSVINNTKYIEDYDKLLYYRTDGNNLLNFTEVEWNESILLDLEGIELVYVEKIY